MNSAKEKAVPMAKYFSYITDIFSFLHQNRVLQFKYAFRKHKQCFNKIYLAEVPYCTMHPRHQF